MNYTLFANGEYVKFQSNVDRPALPTIRSPLRHFTAHKVDTVAPQQHHLRMEQVIKRPRKQITTRVSTAVGSTLPQEAKNPGARVKPIIMRRVCHKAQSILKRKSVIGLSREDARKILSLLDTPPKPNKALREAVRAFRELG